MPKMIKWLKIENRAFKVVVSKMETVAKKEKEIIKMIYTIKLDIEIDDKCKMEALNLNEGIRDIMMRGAWQIINIDNLDILKIDDKVIKNILYPPVAIGDTVYFAYIKTLDGDKIIRPWLVRGLMYKNGDWYAIENDGEQYKIGSEYAFLTEKESEIYLDMEYEKWAQRERETWRQEVDDLYHYASEVADKYKVDIKTEIETIKTKISEQANKKIKEGK